MEKGYNLGFESHPTSKDVGFHGANKDSWGCESVPIIVTRPQAQHTGMANSERGTKPG